MSLDDPGGQVPSAGRDLAASSDLKTYFAPSYSRGSTSLKRSWVAMASFLRRLLRRATRVFCTCLNLSGLATNSGHEKGDRLPTLAVGTGARTVPWARWVLRATSWQVRKFLVQQHLRCKK